MRAQLGGRAKPRNATLVPATRTALHAIAAHVLGRRRFDVSGRFGLRATPGGVATPAFGVSPETIRISGLTLIREVGGEYTCVPVNGSTLRELAAFVDTDLGQPFSVGAETPTLGPIDAPLGLDASTVDEIADWFSLGWKVLDDVLASLPDQSERTTIQLWPEHFDAATTVTLPRTEPANLGFSPGDEFESEPYVYIGSSGANRPGDKAFWNAPFGAMRRLSQVRDSSDSVAFCRQFLAEGLDFLASS